MAERQGQIASVMDADPVLLAELERCAAEVRGGQRTQKQSAHLRERIRGLLGGQQGAADLAAENGGDLQPAEIGNQKESRPLSSLAPSPPPAEPAGGHPPGRASTGRTVSPPLLLGGAESLFLMALTDPNMSVVEGATSARVDEHGADPAQQPHYNHRCCLTRCSTPARNSAGWPARFPATPLRR
jgi:hypothetical protein